MPGLGLTMLLAVQALAGDGLAPLGPGHPAMGRRADLVLRTPVDLGEGHRVDLKILASDAFTDAPLAAKISLSLSGPKGSDMLETTAQPAALDGHYLAATTFARAGRYAAVARVETQGDTDLVVADDILVNGPTRAGVVAPPRWPWLVGAALLLLLLAVRRRRLLPAVGLLVLLGLSIGEAWAHAGFVPPPAASLDADVVVPQEIQFALGLRTQPAAVETFPPPAGTALAPRLSLSVPQSAIVEREGHKLIFVRLAPETFVAREPKLGWPTSDGARIAVLSGLELDEKVVVQGAAFLRNGGVRIP